MGTYYPALERAQRARRLRNLRVALTIAALSLAAGAAVALAWL